MKKGTKKVLSAIISILLAFSLFSVTVFAADSQDLTKGLKNYLSNDKNTGFDFSETSFSDNDIDWTLFALLRSGEKSVYTQYNDYINEVVKSSFQKLYPSDIARIALAVTANGIDATNVGGENLIDALASVDYSSQIYLSSLSYPLLAMNYYGYSISDSLLKSIVDTVLASQQSDGGFPYCSVDLYGYGISSDVDSTAMTVQALAKYYKTDSAISEAVDKALAYIKTQQFSDGSFGSIAYNSKSGESTSQVITALCMLGIDPTSADYTTSVGNPVTSLDQFTDTAIGAALDYSGKPNTMSSYQMLMGLTAYNRFVNNENNLFTKDKVASTTTAASVTVTNQNDTSDYNETNVEATTTKNVDIPKTGNRDMLIMSVSLAVLAFGSAIVIKRKNEKV